MVTKTKMSSKPVQSAKDMAASYKDSAQQIWLAGLGAFGKAQEQGGKVFDALVKEGQALQLKTQTLAQEQFSTVSSKVSAKANEVRDEVLSKSNVQWGKLEGLFEERVAKALKAMGLPTQKDIAELHKRLAALEGKKAVASVKAAPAKTAPTKSAPAKSAPVKAVAKTTAKKVTPGAAK
jgi:poly(hydroxyalkanoate) granule-associated protein